MTDPERIAVLEQRVNNLDDTVEQLRREVSDARDRDAKAALDAMDLKGQLAKLIEALAAHEKLHEKGEEKKYKLTDIVLAVGMLGIAAMELFKK